MGRTRRLRLDVLNLVGSHWAQQRPLPTRTSHRPTAGCAQLPKPATICDGLQARLGSLTWPIVQRLVDDVVTVSEEEIVAAMQLVMERMKASGACLCWDHGWDGVLLCGHGFGLASWSRNDRGQVSAGCCWRAAQCDSQMGKHLPAG